MDLADLLKQRNKLDEDILQARRQEARLNGVSFTSLLELMQRAYPQEAVIELEGSFYRNSVAAGNALQVPDHYDCPKCGVVKGEQMTEPWGEPPKNPHYGGDRFYCKVCDTYLDEQMRWIR